MSNEYVFVAMLSINDWEIPVAMHRNYFPQLDDKEVRELTEEEKTAIFQYVSGAMDAYMKFHPLIKHANTWYGYLKEINCANFIVV